MAQRDGWQLRLCDPGAQAQCPSGLQAGPALTTTGVLIPACGPAGGPERKAMGGLGQAEGCAGRGPGEPQQGQVGALAVVVIGPRQLQSCHPHRLGPWAQPLTLQRTQDN